MVLTTALQPPQCLILMNQEAIVVKGKDLGHKWFGRRVVEQQPNDQTGFRPNTGIDDAFVVLECLSSKSLEWNAPIWFASLDLTKAFDRIEYNPLFDALLQQGVPRCYCTLLWNLYKGQTGSVHGSERFNIERGKAR